MRPNASAEGTPKIVRAVAVAIPKMAIEMI
jgi:hypothetical protein